MKKLRVLFMALFAIMLLSGTAMAQEKSKDKNIATVTFDCDIDCASCKAKIEKNLPFEKGVKEFIVSLEDKTVVVKYRKDKNSDEKLRESLEKLGYKTSVKKESAKE